MRIDKKKLLEKKRCWRIRRKIRGTKVRPRMSVRFTQRNIHVQFIDDDAGITLAAATSLSKSVPNRETLAANVEGAKRLGAAAAETALKAGIKQVVFDRSGARFHGKVKALADAAREKGLEF